MDPYYRTIEGFEVLIEKDFLSFGHPFKFRSGSIMENSLNMSEFSPIFIQFLDCVYQILRQYPILFQFNEQFLLDIAFYHDSLRYGTFIGNCERDRRELNLSQCTISLWTEVNNNMESYLNVMYDPNSTIINKDQFYPEASLSSIKLWENFYMRFSSPIIK